MLSPFRARSALLVIGIVAASSPGLAQSGSPPPAAPAPPASPPSQQREAGSESALPERSGFFLRMAPGLTFMSLNSDRSALSAFRQSLASSATAYGGSLELQIGAAVAPELVLAGAIEQISVSDARVEILGQTVAVEDLQFESISIGLAASYYPWQRRGWCFSGKVAYGGLDATDAEDWPYAGSLGGEQLKGVLAEAGAGHDWWIGRHWWLGLAARAGYGRMTADTDLATVSLFATATLL